MKSTADELPEYHCKRHGKVEPKVSVRSSGYTARRCPLCLKEGFDKLAWQRERRARARAGLAAVGRSYERISDDAPYTCSRCGGHDCYVGRTKEGTAARRCPKCEREKDNARRYMRAWNKTLRGQVLAAYGNRCVCCGETRVGFLSIDHVNNDGSHHRRASGNNVYGSIRAAGFPQDGRFQVLCYNCNLGRAFNGGICPHKSVES